MSSLRESVLEFQKSVYNVISKESFLNQFCALSRKENRREMIEMIIELPEVTNLIIEQYYHAKNDNLAKDLYNQVFSLNSKNEENKKSLLLTKALFASTYTSKIFFEILIERVKTWYKLQKFSKCIKDCKYLQQLKNISPEGDYYEELRIESLLIESECYRKINAAENSKSCLNKAMQIVNDFVKKTCVSEDVFKKEKIDFLKPIFERLNVMKKWTAKNPEAENINNLLAKELKIPNVDGKASEKLKACSDAISLGYSETKGRFLFATRRIKTGSVLIIDEPFTFSTDEEALERNCLNCHISLKMEDNIRIPCRNCQTASYCSETCREDSWEKYHKYECSVFNYFYNFESQEIHQGKSHLLLAYRTTIAKALTKSNIIDTEFLHYHAVDGQPEEISLKIGSEIYDPLNYKTVYSLETHCAETDPKKNLLLALRSIFLVKLLVFSLRDINPELLIDQTQIILLAVGTFRHMQAIACNAYEIVENVRNEESRVYEPRNIGGAIYTSVSLSNHSCYPNVVRHSYPRSIVVVRALRPIEKGAEILDCYGPHFLKDEKNMRRECLVKKYHFFCTCEACSFDWKMPLSDEIQYKCSCSNLMVKSIPEKCSKCSNRIDCKKIHRRLEESKKKRLSAISKIYEDNHAEALPILLDYSNFIEKNLAEPNLEAIKTQQAIIQCWNSMACTSV